MSSGRDFFDNLRQEAQEASCLFWRLPGRLPGFVMTQNNEFQLILTLLNLFCGKDDFIRKLPYD